MSTAEIARLRGQKQTGEPEADRWMTFDKATTDPIQNAVRDALIAFVAATAQAEASKEAQRPGIAHTPILRTVGSTGAASPASRATSSGPSRTCSRWAQA